MTVPVSNETAAQNSAVINPYALAELIVGRKINWRTVQDAPRLLETILQTPYEELFDPKYEGPLYTGLRLNARMQLERVRSPLLDVEVTVPFSDLESPFPGTTEVRRLADLGPRFRTSDIGSIEVTRAELRGRKIELTLRLPSAEGLEHLRQVLPRDIVLTISPDLAGGAGADWTPPNGTWGDAGRFFNETAEFFDPIQGAVANCYFIAALSAVAWAMPHRIQHVTRATGVAQDQFVNRISFCVQDAGGVVDREVEVTDTVPLSMGNFIYCRSSEAGESWPAIYEKAFAKFITGTSTDHPDITMTAWGDCVSATGQLTGGVRSWYDTASRSGDDLWDLVRGNSLGRRTFKPMTAWTYSSGDAAPKKVVYADGNIVGAHCYTVLGWDFRNNQKYLILRNPWGNTEATVGVLAGTTTLYDISWWRPINLAAVDGTFGIEAGAFQRYFAGLGVAK